MWTYKGKCWLVPKEEGYGIIISTLQSRGFGFGYPLIVTYLKIINEYHSLHPKYVDTYVATTILVHTNNETIKMGRNPLCQEVEYRAIAKGYCNYGWGPAQDAPYDLILWYVSKIVYLL